MILPLLDAHLAKFVVIQNISPVFFTLPSISSAYAGTGLRRSASISARIFWNKAFDTATSAYWNVTYQCSASFANASRSLNASTY
jgi:hypothetical protein